MAGEVSAVFPDHCDVNGESATHGFINNLFELELREAAFGPKALKDAAMFYLDKGAGFTGIHFPQTAMNSPPGSTVQVGALIRWVSL